MGEIAKGVLGGSWTLILGWVLPTSLGLAFFGLLVLPSLTNVPVLADVNAASAANQAVVLLASSLILGLTLASVSTPLYRLLEGYAWPDSLAARRTGVHVERRHHAAAGVTASQDGGEAPAARAARHLERFRRYPDSDSQVLPTSLGNAIRRFEYYSYDRYRLSSQLMWNQLRGVSGESVTKDVDDAKAGVDFFVCLLYVSGVVSASALLALVSPERHVVALSFAGVVGAVAAAACYPLAVVATDAWASAVKAMVDLGRLPLARALGLELPDTLAQEREMWQQVGWFHGYRFHDEAVAELDRYRRTEDAVDD